ncbi:DUF4835 family protein [Flavobacterium psychrophilum]|uniref:type IX secretion system protein PorD n=1 Tax=Flavobacterium psychrophilum TaxID=96345 RepID=UPI000B7C3C50|nr:DUF4835 family protein [Flavobacterium psychrophilum]EKT4497972.1 DUF4835 family protein [Flavobacterium psychrophilum]EKT4548890.1 DUF4835 family protein [Flavobacterium psychrophilum]ELV7525064.1 DUF4835 family protein [Flavobacterium psychrophilum]ELY1992041.1 DUF4835 family protein [Flavobacterium psychrophilum]QZK98486.1 DUF4835 family protein [Flavobacterium psychrophilum]
MRKIIVFLFLLFFGFTQAQELNCAVNFNTDQVAATNQQVFKTLKKSLTEFVNNTKWSDKTYKGIEKIECSFFFTIATYNADQFTGTLQVQASRPIYNSNYLSPILNINDKDIDFKYLEFQNLTFDANSFDSNLLSIMAFYSNLIVGLDADTFSLEGGSKSLENAQNIATLAQQSQIKGWSQSDKTQNRYFLINDMLSPTFVAFRKTMYEYHLKALDKMADNPKEAKENIKIALKTLSEIADTRPNAYLTRVFFDAKSDEILSIYADGPKVDVTEVINSLNRLSPTNSSKWGKIIY